MEHVRRLLCIPKILEMFFVSGQKQQVISIILLYLMALFCVYEKLKYLCLIMEDKCR